jgi:hypothetical protein
MLARRHSITRSIVAGLLSGALLAQPAIADIIRLRDGLEHEGTLANRDELLRQPRAFDVISILVASPDDPSQVRMVRVPAADIEYLVFENGNDRTVIDLYSLVDAPSQPSGSGSAMTSEEEIASAKRGGAVLMLLGAVAFGVGVGKKFGEEQLVVSQDLTYEIENSYNAVNYVLMIGGGAMFIGGIAVIASANSKAASSGVSGFISDGVPHLAYNKTF